MSDLDPVSKWVLGIAGSLLGAALISIAGMLFSMQGRISTLEATQVQLITQINRTLDALQGD